MKNKKIIKTKSVNKKLENLKESVNKSSSGYGGKRDGSGRKKGDKAYKTILKEQIQEQLTNFGVEEIEVKQINKGNVRTINKARVLLILEILFKEAYLNKNIQAAGMFLDRVAGKAMQPLRHEGEIKTHEQGRPNSPAVKAAIKEYHRVLDEER